MNKIYNLSLSDINVFSEVTDINTKDDIDSALFFFLSNNDFDYQSMSNILFYLKNIGYKHPEKIIDAANIRKNINKSLVELNNPYEFRDCIKNYHVILNKVKTLFSELSIDCSLDLCVFYTIMLQKGYFSINKSNIYEGKNIMNIDNYFAFDVFNGQGCCLNYSDFLVDILSCCGYSSTIAVNFLSSNPLNNIKYLVLKNFPFKSANHASALILDNNMPYIFDPTNITAFECINNEKAIDYLLDRRMSIDKLHSLTLCDSKKKLHIMKKFYCLNKFDSPYNKKELLISYKNQREKIETSRKILEDFYCDSFSIINDVHNISKKLVRTKY